MRALLLITILAFFFAVNSPAPLPAQGLEYVKTHYTKQEFEIPMRDGVRLFTAVYSPKYTTETYPLLMIRTQSGVLPYGKDQFPNDLGPSAFFAKAGYIFVYQDIRGRWASEGTFVNMRPHNPAKQGPRDVDESSDTHDTIEWLLKNVANHNGKVGHYGTSYRGFLAAAGAIDAHPALKAVSPQAPIGDWFRTDDWHHNGALILNHVFFYLPIMGKARPAPFKAPPIRPDYGTHDGYNFYLKLGPLSNVETLYYKGEVPYWNEFVNHSTHDDFWKARYLVPHLKNIKPALLLVGGWFDAENLCGTMEYYHQIATASPATTSTLVMGPWIHGGWNDRNVDGSRLGPVPFDAPTAEYYREQIEFPFFEFHLKGKGEFQPPKMLMFETGTNRWHDHDVWPPRATTPYTLYFQDRGKLSQKPATAAEAESTFDEYVSDPAKPVPYIDKTGFRMMPEFMAADQRFAACRPDVLAYETEPLSEDITLVGPIVADLRVSTSGTDSDWIVKLIDVYPADFPDPNPNPSGVRMGGYQQLVRGEVMRGKFRDSLEKPQAFTPGEPTVVNFKLPDVYHTFQRGHKIMVHVQSTWFPLVDRNPQTFVDIYRAKESDFQKAVQRVYRSPTFPSRLVAERMTR